MDEIQVETLREQPNSALQPAFQPDPVKLDGLDVRAAMQEAAKAGVDPFTLTVGDMANPTAKAETEKPVEIPEKFKKPNGEVDVEKLKTSTERLNEAVQDKEQKVQEAQKSVEDMVREYRALEAKNAQLPNPQKLAAQIPIPPPTAAPSAMSDQQLEALINADLQANPARTVAQLVAIHVQKELSDRLKPIEEDRKIGTIRENIQKIAEKDPRILNQGAFDAVNAKLRDNPEMWSLKNPHKAAWLEVKEELHLGELSQAPAQPSKPSAPILGGGTPPPAPSLSDARTTAQTLDSAISQLSFDPRKGKVDPKHQAALDDAAKRFFDEQERFRPR
jgi:hypothetical protein